MSGRRQREGDAGSARQRRAWWLGGTLIACVVLATVAVALNDLRVRREAGERYLQALVDSHAREVGQRIDGVQRAFHGLVNGLEAIESVAPGVAPVFAREQVARIASGHPHVHGLRMERVAPEFVPPDASERYRLYLGTPGRDARGRWVIPLAMPFDWDAAGQASRWLRAELDADAFTEILRVHEVGAQGVASLLTLDAILIARSDSGTRHAGLDVARSPVFAPSADPRQGVVRARSLLDGVERFVGYRRIDGRPLMATVGMTPEAMYGGWWTFVATLAAGVLALLAAWVGGMAMLGRAAGREARMRRDIAASEDAVGHLRERVRDAEAQYRFLYQQHPLPAIVYDRETLAILETNDAALHQFRRERESMLGIGVGDLLVDGTGEDLRQEILAHPQAYGHRTWTMRRGDGTTFSGLVFARDLVAFDERPARLALALDVTDRVRAEADLRLLRRAVEASEEGVFILGAESGSLVYGNQAFARLTGVDTGQDGSERAEAVDAIVDPRARRLVTRAMARGEDVQVEVRDGRNPADERCLEVRLTPVVDREGQASHFVGIVGDVTMRKRAAEELAFRASHDALTGLANRDCLIRAIDEAMEGGAALAVCHLDLDRFQLVNDSLGHGVGDQLLVAVARTLEAAAGAQALVARLGGDEFGVMLPLAPGAVAGPCVDALRAAVAGPVEVSGISLHVTPSIGYSLHPGDGDDGTTLLRAASQAGAQAKRLGRNRSLAYCSGFDSHAGERLLLVQELHKALQREEFELAFQLQYGAEGKPCGMEALVRWRHPERGVLGPGVFMPACEDSGLILPLGRWVLREAVRCWRRLDEAGWGALRMGVNVSALQFQQHLVEDVAQVMAEFRLPRGRLELELTESVLLASPVDARRVMEALSALGVSLAVDDFGTGYSSLAYLKHLPVERLKLDQSFVRDLGRDPDTEAICDAILRMAQGLELAVIAEGVETWHQHEWLRARGCDEFQGFLLARPAPFDAVLRELGEGPAT
ncbi:EAL domain-containing protein [Luteimonas sp. MC1750]|uniref:bifunctional diguanylate cyclase/phosphodiesterase n=1 Tax=Luteimonas sp. MC1750 TaxID=2799326 RepID=UPI0018F0D825|nr:EAL domain-containing protein [Luteimonas sp. MC1750]MBJ6985083.1 EAL domain-containing protein [Luteimonas sp. MC1750]QQO05744.1 EAL domain-containing protein [Luteimonas sp. MC1750]